MLVSGFITKLTKMSPSGHTQRHSRQQSNTENENIHSLNSYYARDSSCTKNPESNLPYQDTFDNGGVDDKEPLASARYRSSVTYRDDSVSTNKSKDAPITQRVRHHRNISHASFPSENSDDEESKN
jgi:hypothetical protein